MPRRDRDIDVIDRLLRDCWVEVVIRCAQTLLQSSRQEVRQLPNIERLASNNIQILTRQYPPALRDLLSNALHANAADYDLIERMIQHRERGQVRAFRDGIIRVSQQVTNIPSTPIVHPLSATHSSKISSQFIHLPRAPTRSDASCRH